MSSDTELITSRFLNAQSDQSDTEVPPESVNQPTVRSTSSQILGGVKWFLGFVLVAAIYMTAGKWACKEANQSTAAADWCLWVAGSDKTWDEYQKDQVAKGNPRLKDKKLGWVGQLVQDAYAGNNR
jgi:hypothetical protein